MNRQRAVKYLNALAEHFDDQNQRFIGGDIREGGSALWAPAPDPDTGLVPCGCGGKVEVAFYPGWHGVPDMYQVDCFNCHVGTRPCQTAEQAKASWNTAMGFDKEAADEMP